MDIMAGLAAVGYLLLGLGWVVSATYLLLFIIGDLPDTVEENTVLFSILVCTVFFTWAVP